MTIDPAAPHAFGCTRCVESARAQGAAERATARLLKLAGDLETRLDASRREIASLEQQIARGRPSLLHDEPSVA